MAWGRALATAALEVWEDWAREWTMDANDDAIPGFDYAYGGRADGTSLWIPMRGQRGGGFDATALQERMATSLDAAGFTVADPSELAPYCDDLAKGVNSYLSQAKMQVSVSGYVPTFAPPYVPAGPVVIRNETVGPEELRFTHFLL